MNNLNETALKNLYWTYFLLFAIACGFVEISLFLMTGFTALLAALIWIPFSFVIYKYSQKKTKLILPYAVTNAVLAGVAMSSYYLVKDVQPQSALPLIIGFAALLGVHFVLIQKIKNKALFLNINTYASIAFGVVALLIILESHTPIAAALFFTAVIYMCFNIAMFKSINRDWSSNKIVSVASLWMFLGAILGVLAILTDGGGLDLYSDGRNANFKNKK